MPPLGPVCAGADREMACCNGEEGRRAVSCSLRPEHRSHSVDLGSGNWSDSDWARKKPSRNRGSSYREPRDAAGNHAGAARRARAAHGSSGFFRFAVVSRTAADGACRWQTLADNKIRFVEYSHWSAVLFPGEGWCPGQDSYLRHTV